ncbi:MAG: hypothetical protein ACXVRE_05225 [Gaiellaceae bacterium]
MPWLVKALFVLVKTRRGRELLFAVGLGAFELARHERARKLYAQARATVTDPALRRTVTRYARKAAQTIRP